MSGNPLQPPVPGKEAERVYQPYHPHGDGPAQHSEQTSGFPSSQSQVPPQSQGFPHQDALHQSVPHQDAHHGVSHQIAHQDASELPPAYVDQGHNLAPPEKPPISTAQVDAVPQQHQQAYEQQYYPPPPSGPPPSDQKHPQPTTQFSQPPQSTTGSNPSAFYQGSNEYEGPPPALPGPRPVQHSNEIPLPEHTAPHTAPHHQAGHAIPLHNQHAAVGQTQQAGSSHRSWSTRLTEIGHKAAAPINALANKMGSQSFLPTALDKECEKAAFILKSFCKEGIASDAAAINPAAVGSAPKPVGETTKQSKDRRAMIKIPSKVIAKAQGLAIFTTARVGYAFSGATGSGILLARLPDGSWSPPSGIQVHAVGAGFMIGVDIYDCVCVINSRDALAAFMSTRVSLGPDVAVTAGPYGVGGIMDVGGAVQSADDRKAAEAQKAQLAAQQQHDHVTDKPEAVGIGAGVGAGDASQGALKPGKDGHQRRSSSVSFKPVFTYVKSRGFYAGVQVDGTVITERKDANASFYGARVSVDQIMRGDVPAAQQQGVSWRTGVQPIYDALRVAESQQALPDAGIAPPPPPPVGQQHGLGGQQHGLGGQQHGLGGQQYPGPGGQYDASKPSNLPNYDDPHSAGGHYAPGQGPSGQFQGAPTMSGAGSRQAGDQLPGYQEDGVHRPGVGDEKVHYQ